MSKLEIISRTPSSSSNKPELLFIHGAFAGAWCWDEYFLPYFAKNGYKAHALSLRGHGNSQGEVNLATVADFVADVQNAVATLNTTPVLIGHSMGGMVVQHYLSHNPATGAILMNSVPPSGLSSSLCYMAMLKPQLLTQLSLIQSLGNQFATPNMLKQALFSTDDINVDIMDKFFHAWQNESQLAVAEMFAWQMVSKFNNMPILVVGAGKDVFFPYANTRDIAYYYGADWHIFNHLAHALMLENDWQQVADYIINWLEKKLCCV
jgi:pimeloyl-ACP methyl ester carboxylesterase